MLNIMKISAIIVNGAEHLYLRFICDPSLYLPYIPANALSKITRFARVHGFSPVIGMSGYLRSMSVNIRTKSVRSSLNNG